MLRIRRKRENLHYNDLFIEIIVCSQNCRRAVYEGYYILYRRVIGYLVRRTLRSRGARSDNWANRNILLSGLTGKTKSGEVLAVSGWLLIRGFECSMHSECISSYLCEYILWPIWKIDISLMKIKRRTRHTFLSLFVSLIFIISITARIFQRNFTRTYCIWKYI